MGSSGGASKMAPASLFFTEKRLFQENVWQGSSGGAGARAGEEPCQTGPKKRIDIQIWVEEDLNLSG